MKAKLKMDFKELFKKDLPPKCYLCGRSDVELEADHIPPKCIFPKQYHAQLITVPICNQCHDKRDKDDEYFRDYITIWCGKNVPDDVHQKRERSWNKHMSHKIATIKNLARAWVKLPSGLNVLGYALGGEKSRINPVLECITRGYNFYRCHNVVPECEVKILMTKAPFVEELEDQEARFWRNLTGSEEVIPNMFKLLASLFKKDNVHISNWFFEFYNTVQFFVQLSWVQQNTRKV